MPNVRPSRISLSSALPLSHTPGYLALQLREEYAVTRHDGRPRRHTHDVWEVKLVRSATQIFRTTFSSAIKAALAIARLRILLKQKKNDVTDDGDDTTLRSPGFIPRPPCGGLYCAYALSNGPLVVCYSPLFFFVCIMDDYRFPCRRVLIKKLHGKIARTRVRV